MMANNGWIALHRQLLDNWVWQKADTGYAWVDLLLLANHEDVKGMYKGEVVTFQRGTVNRSIASLADRWGWSRDKARRFLSALESDGMVRVNATTNKTTITIVKYDDFQLQVATNKATNRQRVRQRADSEPTQTTMNNNDNNDNNTRQRRGTSHRKSDMDRISEIIAQMREEEDEDGEE